MARQDYAQKRRRSNSASRTPAKRQSSAPPPRRKKPWWPRAILAGVGLFGLVYLLKLLIATGPSDLQDTRVEPRQERVAPRQQPAPAPQAPRQQAVPQPAPVPVQPPAPVVVPAAPEAVPEPQVVEIPPPPEAPEARFDFYDILPRSQVQAPQGVYHSTPRDAPDAQSRFLLQTGSFREEADAERMRAQLLLSGLPNVHTSRVEGDNGIWYRVRTGPFNNRTELNRARNQLTSLGISPMPIPLN